MSDPARTSEQEARTCPNGVCQCGDWPPTECPQCGVRTLGFTPEDWWRHFDEECDTLGGLFCFAERPTELKS